MPKVTKATDKLRLAIATILIATSAGSACANATFEQVKTSYRSSDTLLLDRQGEVLHRLRTDPLQIDTDGDTLTDGQEIELGTDPLVVAVHRNHPLAHRQAVSIDVVAGHCLLMREQGSTTRRLTEQMLEEAGVKVGSLLEIGSRESIREAVLRNIGISIIARHEVPHNPELRVLALEGAPVMHEYLYCLKERRQARLPAAFLGVAQEVAGSQF